MLLVAVIFVIILILQFALAVFAQITQHNLHKKYNKPLGEMVEAAKVLELYNRIYRKTNIRVNAEIRLPAIALEEFVLVNRSKMYNFDLYTNFFTIFQLELARKEYGFVRRLEIFQNIIFFLQLVFFIVGISGLTNIGMNLLLIGIGIQILSILISLIGYYALERILGDTLEISQDLLNLDEVETGYAINLKNDLKNEPLTYPFNLFVNIARFFLPF